MPFGQEHLWTVIAHGLPTDRQYPLIEPFGLLVVLLDLRQASQMMEADRHMRMLRSKEELSNVQRSLKQLLCSFIVVLFVLRNVEPGQILQATSCIQMQGIKRSLTDRLDPQ